MKPIIGTVSITPTPEFVMLPAGDGGWLSTNTVIVRSKTLDNHLMIPAGAHNNLASIPRAARLLFPVNGPHRIAAYVHDYLYSVEGRVLQGKITRKQADELFHEIMRMPACDYYRQMHEFYRNEAKANGVDVDSEEPMVNSMAAGIMYRAVRIGGSFFWKDDDD